MEGSSKTPGAGKFFAVTRCGQNPDVEAHPSQQLLP
jgi:hypothetical protein